MSAAAIDRRALERAIRWARGQAEIWSYRSESARSYMETNYAALADAAEAHLATLPAAAEGTKLYRKKPAVIEAVQWYPNVDHPGVAEDAGKRLTDFYSPAPGSAMRDLPAYFVVTIHEQRAYLVPGDWILPEPKEDRFYPCKPDIFAATYEAAA